MCCPLCKHVLRKVEVDEATDAEADAEEEEEEAASEEAATLPEDTAAAAGLAVSADSIQLELTSAEEDAGGGLMYEPAVALDGSREGDGEQGDEVA